MLVPMETHRTMSVFLLVAWACLAVCSSAGGSELDALEERAARGDAEAQFQLGRAYFRGEGVPKDEKKAFEWIEKSAEQGNIDAINSMGYLALHGEGEARDEEQAVVWFERGVEADSPVSKLNLGLILRQGKKIKLDNEKSLELMHAAAVDGLPQAKAYLGRLYFGGDRLMGSDYEKARPFLLEAAGAGDAVCQNMLGILSRDGIGPKARFRDRKEAEAWFRKSAMQNHLKAQSNLADLLGVDSPSSHTREEALKWLIIAHDQGEITAKKTYSELAPKVPAGLMEKARQAAVRQMVILSAKVGHQVEEAKPTGP
jgi:TPR repeat protein